MVTPEATPQAQTPLKRQILAFVQDKFTLSERHACTILGFWRSTQRRKNPKKAKDAALIERLRHLARERPRFGYRRLHVLLRREGWQDNHKRIYRLYRAEGLAVRQKTRRKLTAQERFQKPAVSGPNQRWSMDFMSDQFASGQRFRLLNVVDDFTREAVVMQAGTSITGADVVRLLQQTVAQRGRPAAILTDNGPEFTSKVVDQWAHEQSIVHLFIPPGKPVENAQIESFNGRVRDECLNLHWFTSLNQARLIIAAWQHDYNTVRPHSSLKGEAPADVARRSAAD